jgi:hypothetical protein
MPAGVAPGIGMLGLPRDARATKFSFSLSSHWDCRTPLSFQGGLLGSALVSEHLLLWLS